MLVRVYRSRGHDAFYCILYQMALGIAFRLTNSISNFGAKQRPFRHFCTLVQALRPVEADGTGS